MHPVNRNETETLSALALRRAGLRCARRPGPGRGSPPTDGSSRSWQRTAPETLGSAIAHLTFAPDIQYSATMMGVQVPSHRPSSIGGFL